MPSFLVNRRMDPALADRVLATVRGRKPKPGSGVLVRRIVAMARVVLVLTAALAIYSGLTLRRAAQREVETARTRLLEKVQAEAATLEPQDRAALARAESWLTRLSGNYDGDVLGGDDLLARPMIYVRGPIASFGTSDAIADAAAASYKDALLLCLLEPPTGRSETELLVKVRLARSGAAAVEERTPTVRRLHDLVIGLPLLLPPWSERVRAATDGTELTRLRKELERAPLERAKQAARANVLLVAMDEPGEGNAELDGERPHDVRLALVDLTANQVALRVRRHVDPKWITPAKRPTAANDLDGCALAYDVREELKKRR